MSQLSAGATYGGGVDEARVASTAMHLVAETVRLQVRISNPVSRSLPVETLLKPAEIPLQNPVSRSPPYTNPVHTS
jgi:hypothetical protein